MRLQDIWPTLGKKEWYPITKPKPKAGVCSKGRKHMHQYYCRYTHVLSAWIAERNLRGKK